MSLALLVIATLFGAASANDPPPIRIAYFVPSDRQPIDGYVERLDRVMTEVQQFYRRGMARSFCPAPSLPIRLPSVSPPSTIGRRFRPTTTP
jgi:hypothetical protein